MSVYFIEAEGVGLIKIGYTDGSPRSRLGSLQTSSPVPLRLLASMPGSLASESDMHQRFGHLRTKGEWFRAERDLLDFVKALPPPEPAPGARRAKPARCRAPKPEPDPPRFETYWFAEDFTDPVTGFRWQIWVDRERRGLMYRSDPKANGRSYTRAELGRVSKRSDLFIYRWHDGRWHPPAVRVGLDAPTEEFEVMSPWDARVEVLSPLH